MRFVFSALLTWLIPACDRPNAGSDRDGNGTERAMAVLRDAHGKEVGRATLTQGEDGVRIRLEARGLPPGKHGFHIHEKGECHPPKFESAGGHFNPDGRKHGLENPDGPHAGDLPNILVGDDGTVRTTVFAPLVRLGEGKHSILRPGGMSLVLHERPDDGKTDPDGNAGARIACGVIRSEEP